MDKIVDLARRMRAKRESGPHPYVLVLGAGASVASGTSLNRVGVERVVGRYDVQPFDAYLTQCSDVGVVVAGNGRSYALTGGQLPERITSAGPPTDAGHG